VPTSAPLNNDSPHSGAQHARSQSAGQRTWCRSRTPRTPLAAVPSGTPDTRAERNTIVLVTYLLLAVAILAEVTGTISLQLSNGFSRLGPSLVVVVGYVISFLLLSIVLKRGLPVAVAYAVWSALGVALIAGVGVVWLDQRLSALQVLGLALVVAGVVALEVGGVTARS
jgi:small multidrug resistance pump